MRCIAVCLLVAACARPADPPQRREKPQAPVQAWIAARDLGGGVHEMTLTAVPTTRVSALDLSLRLPAGVSAVDPPQPRHGATRAGVPRLLITRVRLAGSGADVAGAARVPMPSGQWRARPVLARVGTAAPLAAPAPLRSLTLPS